MKAEPSDAFLVAGETSGDQLGGKLMAALRKQASAIRFRGVGGREMQAQGLPSLFPMEDLTAIGFAPVIAKLPLIWRRLRQTVAAIVENPPDMLVLIDAPDFSQRVARRVRAALPHLPIIKYVSPTVWVWRPGRAAAMRPFVDRVLALFPFEPEVYRRLGGPECVYVGHPIVDRLADLRPSPEEFVARNHARPLMLVLPGSRRSEIARLAPIFGDAVARIAGRVAADFLLPTLPERAELVAEAVSSWRVKPRIVANEDEKFAAFRRARAALAASGTVTLELAFAQVPMVAAYIVPRLEAAILRRIALVDSAILPNLVLKEKVVPELLQQECTGVGLAEALLHVVADGPARARQLAAFSRLDELFGTEAGAVSDRAAAAALATYRAKQVSAANS